MAHGSDDAAALGFAGFVIGMDKHDLAGAFTAFDAALAVSPSSALTYILGSTILAFGGEAERAVEWSERGVRLSPLDPYRASAFIAAALGHLQCGRYDDAAAAARKAVQATPDFSASQFTLAAALVKLGRLDEAKAAGARVLQLQPNFTIGRQLEGVGCAPVLAALLRDALRQAGLPE